MNVCRLIVDSTLRQNDSNPRLTACTIDIDALLHDYKVKLMFFLQPFSDERIFAPRRSDKPLLRKISHIPACDRRLISLGIGRILLSLRCGLSNLNIGRFIKWQIASHPPSHIFLPDGLPLLSAGEVALFAGHYLPRMNDIEKHESDEHESGVEDVLVCFVDWDAAAVALGVLDQAEDDADLGQCKSCVCLRGVWEE